MNRLIILLVLVVLTGCASTEENLAYYQTIQAIEAKRSEERRIEEAEFLAAIEKVKSSPIAILALVMRRSNRGMGGVSNSDSNPIIQRPYSFVDGIKAAAPIINTGLVWGLGAWGISKLVDNYGTRYTVNGNESNINGSSPCSSGSRDGGISSLESCMANPPAGYNLAGDPLMAPNMSCASFFQ